MVYVFERPGALNVWTLDNTANDAWGNNNGTNNNVTFASTTPPTFLTQSYNYGQYGVFAPTNSSDMTKFIALTDSTAFHATSFTAMFWVKTTQNYDGTILHNWRGDSGWYGWDIRVYGSDGKLNMLATSDGNVDNAYSSGAINTGSWIHLAVTMKANTGITVYKNFAYDNYTAWAKTLRFTGTHYPAIGVRRDNGTSGSNDPFNGNIKDVMFFPYAMTAGQIKQFAAFYKGRLAFA
jgi:hypothetical protein